MQELTLACVILALLIPRVGSCSFSCACIFKQLSVGSWTCPENHEVAYDGGNDGLFSLRKADDSGSLLVFTRSFCDTLISFVYNSRSSYTAATSFLSSLRSGFGLRRQIIVTLGRCFVATLQPTPDLFVCPECGNIPDYIVIDGQALGFRLRDGLKISRPALHLPIMNLKIDHYAVIQEPSIRAGIRKVLRTGDRLSKTDAEALLKLHDVVSSVYPRSRTPAAIENWRLKRHAATLFFRFFRWTSKDDLGGTRPIPAVGDCGGGIQAEPGAGAAAADVQDGPPPVGGLGEGPAPATVSVPWDERDSTCHPRFDTFKAEGTAWATLRPFILALLGDPVVNLFVGHPRPPLRELTVELETEGGGEWRKRANAANAVGFVANFFARVGSLLDKEKPLRLAVGALLRFAVEVDGIVDRDFQAAAKVAADGGQTETADFCRRWLGVTTPAEFDRFSAEPPEFKDKDLDSPYTTFEFFGFLKPVRPAIYTPRAKRPRTAGQPARGRRRGQGRRRGAQAAQEDAGDRCAKAFPKHSDLTAGVFNIVCPHVVTMGFRVMFDAESVADALSVILERFPKLPQVIFYDVACKMDRNGMQRVWHHGHTKAIWT